MVKQVKPLEHKEVKMEVKEEYVKPVFKNTESERIVNTNSDTISMVCKILAGICALIAVIALWIMFSDFIEFGSQVELLKEQVQMMYPFTWEQYWNDPQVQKAISDGYGQLARVPLTVAIPMFIAAGVLLVISKNVVNKAEAPSRIRQVKPITPYTVKQVSPITVSEPIKKSKIKQVKPITQ